MSERFINPDCIEPVDKAAEFHTFVQNQIDLKVQKGIPENFIDIEPIVFTYSGTKGRVWGVHAGVLISDEEMSQYTEDHILTEPEQGDIWLQMKYRKDYAEDTTSEPIGKVEDSTYLSETPKVVLREVTFVKGDRGLSGYTKGKRDFNWNTHYVPDKYIGQWQPQAGDKYKVLVTGIAGNKGGVRFCIPVECTFSQQEANEEYARMRQDALGRGVRLLRLESSSNKGTAFVDDETGIIFEGSLPYLISMESTHIRNEGKSGRSYPGVFTSTDLYEVSEEQYQQLLENQQKQNQVQEEVVPRIRELLEQAQPLIKQGRNDWENRQKYEEQAQPLIREAYKLMRDHNIQDRGILSKYDLGWF